MAINLNNAESSTSVWGMTRAVDVEVPSFVFNVQEVKVYKNGIVEPVSLEEQIFLGNYGQHNTSAIIFNLDHLEINSSDYYQQCVFYNTDENIKNTIRFKNNVLLIPDVITKYAGNYKVILMLIHKQDNSRFVSKEFSGIIKKDAIENLNISKEYINNSNISSGTLDSVDGQQGIRDAIVLGFNEEKNLITNKEVPSIGEEFDRTIRFINVSELFNIIDSQNYYLLVQKHDELKKYLIESECYWIPAEWTKGTEEEVDDKVYIVFAAYGVDEGKEFFYRSNAIELLLEENWLEEEDLTFDYSINWVILSDTKEQILYDNVGAMLQASDD